MKSEKEHINNGKKAIKTLLVLIFPLYKSSRKGSASGNNPVGPLQSKAAKTSMPEKTFFKRPNFPDFIAESCK
jgi:hypothetical protein